MADPQIEASVYNRIVEHVFSGELTPGTKVIEGQLAKQLGVSRIPVRESLRRMVGQGLLTSGTDGGGIRMRQYTPDDLRQLFELRQLLEGGVSRAAARAATDTDISRLEMICKQAETCIEAGDSRGRWGELDHAFHEALADASHNERMATTLKTLLTECHFLFYVFPTKAREQERPSTKSETAERRRKILEAEHFGLIRLIVAGDADGAEELSRSAMRASGQRIIEAFISSRLAK